MTPEEPWMANAFTGDDNYRRRPCFVIAPQNPDQLGWIGSKADGVEKRGGADEETSRGPHAGLPDRLLDGRLRHTALGQEPRMWAAAVPVAGGGTRCGG